MKLPWPVDASIATLRTLVSSITAGWNVEHKADGTHDWDETDLPYSALAFSADTSTWTVDSDDMKVYRYALLGRMMLLAFRVETSDVGAGNQALRVALPTGYSVAKYSYGSMNYLDAGAATDIGLIAAVPGNRFVSLYTRTEANWTNTAGDNTHVQGSILVTVTKD